jgi:hypothetical protein
MSMEMRPYIARGGEQAWRGLSAFKKVTLYGFAVEAKPYLVHQMLTRYIGEPSQELGLHIDVRGTTLKYVLFMFVDSERRQVPLSKQDKHFMGRHPEKLFAVVSLGYRRHPKESWIAFAPYVFASDTPGWTADREIYGYPRQFGEVSINVGNGGLPESCAVSARAIRRFGAEENSEPCEIFRITKTSGASNAVGGQIDGQFDGLKIGDELSRLLGSNDVTLFDRVIPRIVARAQRASTEAQRSFYERRSAAAKQWKVIDSRAPLKSLAAQLNAHTVPMLFLKQFRDITYADRACFQAILEASFGLKHATEGSFATGYQLYLENIDSVPIGRELGIDTGKSVEVAFGFRIALDEMTLSRAEVISNPYWNPGVEFSTCEEQSRLPMYVDRGGDAVWRQPTKLYNARIYGFGVRVPADQQQALLNTFVNDVVAESNSTYGSKKMVLQPCEGIDLVMLLFVDYKRITSGDPNDRKLGGSTYREFLLMQLAISDDEEFPELDWFIPYICLDAEAPRLGGREIFGYPKQLAKIPKFELFDGPSAPAGKLSVQTTVFPKFGSTKAGRDKPIVNLTWNGKEPPTITPFHRTEDMFLALVSRSLPHLVHDSGVRRLVPSVTTGAASNGSPGVGVDMLNALLFTGIGNVFLKEFRDSLNPAAACYQAVCKTDTIPAKFRGGGCVDLPEGYRITIANVASEPLREYFKKSGLYRNEVKPAFAYVLNLDLDLTAGRVIANPMAMDASLDVSLKSTAAKENGGGTSKSKAAMENDGASLTSTAAREKEGRQPPRIRRVATSAEPYWRRVVEDSKADQDA